MGRPGFSAWKIALQLHSPLIFLLAACSHGDEVVWSLSSGPSPTAMAASAAPDILVVLVDTLRPDHLSAYGYERKTSPFLERWGESAALYENAYTHGTHTRIAVASLFSGTLPAVHRVRDVPESFEQRETPSFPVGLERWATTLVAAGYETWGLSSNPYVTSEFGFAEGFTRFWQTNSRDGIQVLETFLEAWSERESRKPARPLFAYLHFMDPHNPYEPPPPFDEKFPVPRGERVHENGLREVSARDLAYTIAQYDGEVLYLDALLERLLTIWERSGSRPRATVVLSDHGEEFQEHGGMGHGVSIYEELARTMLLVKGPGVAPGRYAEPVAHVDVHRLVLDWAVAAVPDLARGRPWEQWDSGAALLYTESLLARAALRVGTRTLVFLRDQPEVGPYYYERAHDPGEHTPLRDEAGLADLIETLERMIGEDRTAAERLGTPSRASPTDVTIEELKALGYLGD